MPLITQYQVTHSVPFADKMEGLQVPDRAARLHEAVTYPFKNKQQVEREVLSAWGKLQACFLPPIVQSVWPVRLGGSAHFYCHVSNCWTTYWDFFNPKTASVQNIMHHKLSLNIYHVGQCRIKKNSRWNNCIFLLLHPSFWSKNGKIVENNELHNYVSLWIHTVCLACWS